MFFQLLINGLITGSIYALSSLGFAIVYNTTRIFHIAYAILYMIPPYIVLLISHQLGLSLVVGIPIALLCTIMISVLIQYLVYRPLELKRSSLHVLMISSIGVMIIGINIIALVFGNETQILNQEISKTIRIGKLIITQAQFLQIGISTFLLITFLVFLKLSKFGIITRALRDDPELCEIYKINIPSFKLALFALSGFFIAVAGILIAWDIGMDPYVGMPLLLNAVVALIIGGIGKFHAPIIGGLFIGILQSIVIWKFSANWQETVTFALLIIFLLFRPQGIFGEKQREA